MSTQVLEVTTAGPIDPIAEFCRTAVSRHAEQWPIEEPALAGEFVEFFGLCSLLTFEELAELCRNCLRVPVSFAVLPDEFRGCNNSFFAKRQILIAENQDFAPATTHTLLHELREIFEHEFEKLGRPTAERHSEDLEHRAELFAIAAQVSAAHKMLPSLLDDAAGIERKWLRYGAYAAIAVGVLVCSFWILSLPRMEESFAVERRRISQLPQRSRLKS